MDLLLLLAALWLPGALRAGAQALALVASGAGARALGTGLPPLALRRRIRGVDVWIGLGAPLSGLALPARAPRSSATRRAAFAGAAAHGLVAAAAFVGPGSTSILWRLFAAWQLLVALHQALGSATTHDPPAPEGWPADPPDPGRAVDRAWLYEALGLPDAAHDILARAALRVARLGLPRNADRLAHGVVGPARAVIAGTLALAGDEPDAAARAFEAALDGQEGPDARAGDPRGARQFERPPAWVDREAWLGLAVAHARASSDAHPRRAEAPEDLRLALADAVAFVAACGRGDTAAATALGPALTRSSPSLAGSRSPQPALPAHLVLGMLAHAQLAAGDHAAARASAEAAARLYASAYALVSASAPFDGALPRWFRATLDAAGVAPAARRGLPPRRGWDVGCVVWYLAFGFAGAAMFLLLLVPAVDDAPLELPGVAPLFVGTVVTCGLLSADTTALGGPTRWRRRLLPLAALLTALLTWYATFRL